MADIGEFLRHQLAATRAINSLQKSIVGKLALPRYPIHDFAFRESAVQAALREVIDRNRAVAGMVAHMDSVFRPALAAAATVANLVETVRPVRDSAAEMGRIQTKWRDLLAPSVRPMALEAHLTGIARMTTISGTLAGMIVPESIGRSLSLGADVRASIVSRFEELTGAYGTLYEAVGASEEAVLGLPPDLTSRPAAEYFTAVDLLETTTGEDLDAEVEEEREAARSEITATTHEPLTASLSDRFPDLIDLVAGARAAFASKHADYVRHFTTSLRELFTQILHRLAPDVEVKKFSTNAEDFPNGKPTRAVRLRYICRAVNSGRFTDFVRKDVAAMLAFVDLFQGGTHEVTTSYTPPQLRALLARMEGTVRFLLEINESE